MVDVTQCHPGSQAKAHSVSISPLPAVPPVVPLSCWLVSRQEGEARKSLALWLFKCLGAQPLGGNTQSACKLGGPQTQP